MGRALGALDENGVQSANEKGKSSKSGQKIRFPLADLAQGPLYKRRKKRKLRRGNEIV